MGTSRSFCTQPVARGAWFDSPYRLRYNEPVQDVAIQPVALTIPETILATDHARPAGSLREPRQSAVSLHVQSPADATQSYRTALAVLRLSSSSGKVSALRPLGHALLAYLIAGARPSHIILWNTLMLCGVLLGLSLTDDYVDWRDAGERNGFARLAQAGARPASWFALLLTACALCTVPWLVLVMRSGVSPAAVAVTGAGLALVASYTLPPLRLKGHPQFSLWVAPLAAGLLFAQAYLIVRPPDLLMVVLAFWCVGLQLYAELVHVLDDAPTPGVPAKLDAPTARRWLTRSQVLMAGYAGLWMWRWPLAGVSVSCALLRVVVCRLATGDRLHRWRRQLWHPFWSFYDLMIYAVLSVSYGGIR